MEIFILDDTFKSLFNLDVFESLLWVEKYNGYGKFEFCTQVNDSALQVLKTVQKKMELKLDCYAWLKDSSSTMIIEDLEITTNSESGSHLFMMSGRGLESILERRIIWNMTVLSGNLQSGVQKLLNDAIISPNISDRKIPNFTFSSSDNEHITSLVLNAQRTGDNLYEAVYEICDAYDLGFDVTLNSNNVFVFSLTYGEDRSYDQNKNQYVIFSPKYENMLNSDYLESIKTLKNVNLVAGEDSGELRKTRTIGSASGLSRREMYTDARDIQSETNDGTLTDEEYNKLLDQRGIEKMSENIYIKAFTGEIKAINTFVYNEDFFKGDIVQIVNEYGMEAKARVLEVIRSQDSEGINVYPTFQVVD